MMDTSTAVLETKSSTNDNCGKSSCRTNETSSAVNNNESNTLAKSSGLDNNNSQLKPKSEPNKNGVCASAPVNKENNLKVNADEEVNDTKKENDLNLSITKEEFSQMSPDALWDKWQLCIKRIDAIEAKVPGTDEDEGLKAQVSELQRKEAYHIMRLTSKEQEVQEMLTGVTAAKCLPINRGSVLDPSVNLGIERLKKELEIARTKMEEAQNELAAWKFTPDSNTGKQLMAKCRSLIKENEELGRVISSGKLAKLEADIALQRNFTEELKKSQSELDEFLLEMDEDTEGMQGTIVYLQDQLRASKQALQQAQESHTISPSVSAAAATTESATEDVSVQKSECESDLSPLSPDNSANNLTCSNNDNVENNLNETRTNEENEVLDAIESQIIPHGQSEPSDSNNELTVKRTLEDDTDPPSDHDGIEPPCKKVKAFVLGQEEEESKEVVKNGD